MPHEIAEHHQTPYNMAKSLSSLWLKNIKRLGKIQQAQGSKLFKNLLTKAVRAKPVRRAQPTKPAKPAKTFKIVPSKAVKLSRKPSVAPTHSASALPGIWQKSYFSPSGSGQIASGRRMLYWLYRPTVASGATSAPMPLVVMLHGCQQTAADFATATRMNDLAERKGFAVLYPQQSAAADAHRCWHWYKRSTQQGQGDVRQVADMIAHVQQRHGLDVSRTYVVGLSAGGALACLVALLHPELIAAAGLHSAPVFGTADSAMGAYRVMQQGSGTAYRKRANECANALELLSGKSGMPAILIHGVSDQVVRRINVVQLSQQFHIINAACITRSEPVRRSYPARTGGRRPLPAYETVTYYAGRKPQLIKCEIDALGHAWSGGDGSVAFSTRAGPDATLMMWNFFMHHRRMPQTA